MLINLSNHPSSKWSKEQTEAARHYGEIVDLPFPVVAPEGDGDYIAALADEYCNKVVELAGGAPVAVHLMGEMTLTFSLVKRFHAKGISCIAATTERVVAEVDGEKRSVFNFVKFRAYEKQ